jgi:hypothetical protein
VSGTTVLVAARDEEARIAATVRRLREAFPGAQVVVADDGSRDGTAAAAESAGARVLRLPRRGKGQALTLAERECPPGALLLCDADLDGDLRPLAASGADVAIAAFTHRTGGGIGLAKAAARALVFPVAAGFGVETRMTIDAVRAGLEVVELDLDLAHRATGRDVRGFAHRGRQLRDLLLATLVPQGRSFRGLRLPLVGSLVAVGAPGVAPVAALGLVDDLWSGPERGFGAHLRGGATTGTLKLVGIPLWALWRTHSLSGAVLVALSANVMNQLDTRPGRALKAFLLGSLVVGADSRGAVAVAVLLAPYDHREMAMLGDAGSNALGAVLGLSSVTRLSGPRRIAAIGALAALTLLADRRSLGALIESTPGLRAIDSLGRYT